MTLFTQVDPDTFINVTAKQPANGRGAWSPSGIGHDYRYSLAKDPAQRIGLLADKSLAHWAVAAGCYALQTRLVQLGHLAPVGAGERGIFGPRTDAAVRAFQKVNKDPATGAKLVVDGISGRGDARAMYTPLIDAAEAKHGIPDNLLRGECNHESSLDPGAVGFYIYYSTGTAYRGVDRGAFQVNAKSHPEVTWAQAYDFAFAADWSAKRMRGYFDQFRAKYPGQDDDLYWRAAVLAHNNPSAAGTYARTGVITTSSAAAYINGVYSAIY